MSIGRDSFSYWFSQATNFVLQFATSIFVARLLGPQLRGEFTGVLLANTMAVNLSNLGLQVLSMYFIGRNKEQLARFHTLIVILVAMITVVDFAILLAGGDALRQKLFEDIPLRYLALALGVLPFSLYYFAAQGVMTGLGRVQGLSRFLFYYAISYNLLSIAALVALPWKVGALLTIWLASQVGAALALFIMIRGAGSVWVWLSPGAAARGLAQLLGYGIRAFVGNFASSLASRMDHLFILSFKGTAEFGVYSLSGKLAELVYQPSASLENAGYARVVSADRDESARLVQDLFRTNLFINGSAVILLMVIAYPFVLIAYGREYLPGVAPLRILLMGTLFLSCSRMMALYFSAQLGRPEIPSTIAWLTLGVNAPLMWWVVKHEGLGFTGAASVTATSYGFMLVCYLSLFALRTGLTNPLPYFMPQPRDFQRFQKLARGILAKRTA